jgi:hypothetical protein
MIENGPGWVRMKHPNTEGEAEVTEAAFDEVWKPKGWEIAEKYTDPSAPSAPDTPALTTPLPPPPRPGDTGGTD